jgi:hypothetical protein
MSLRAQIACDAHLTHTHTDTHTHTRTHTHTTHNTQHTGTRTFTRRICHGERRGVVLSRLRRSVVGLNVVSFPSDLVCSFACCVCLCFRLFCSFAFFGAVVHAADLLIISLSGGALSVSERVGICLVGVVAWSVYSSELVGGGSAQGVCVVCTNAAAVEPHQAHVFGGIARAAKHVALTPRRRGLARRAEHGVRRACRAVQRSVLTTSAFRTRLVLT